MLDIKSLTQEDVGRLVIYQSWSGATIEEGSIKSWNDRFVFVQYDKTGRGIATPPEFLKFTSSNIKQNEKVSKEGGI